MGNVKLSNYEKWWSACGVLRAHISMNPAAHPSELMNSSTSSVVTSRMLYLSFLFPTITIGTLTPIR